MADHPSPLPPPSVSSSSSNSPVSPAPITSPYLKNYETEFETTIRLEVTNNPVLVGQAFRTHFTTKKTFVYYMQRLRFSNGIPQIKERRNKTHLILPLSLSAGHAPILLPYVRTVSVESTLQNVPFDAAQIQDIVERDYFLADDGVRVAFERHYRTNTYAIVCEIEYTGDVASKYVDLSNKERRLGECFLGVVGVLMTASTAASADDDADATTNNRKRRRKRRRDADDGDDQHQQERHLALCRRFIVRNLNLCLNPVSGYHIHLSRSRCFRPLCFTHNYEHVRFCPKWDGFKARVVSNAPGTFVVADDCGTHENVVGVNTFLDLYPKIVFQVEVMVNKGGTECRLILVDFGLVLGQTFYICQTQLAAINFFQKIADAIDTSPSFSVWGIANARFDRQRLALQTHDGRNGRVALNCPPTFPDWYKRDGYIMMYNNVMSKVKPPTIDVRVENGYSYVYNFDNNKTVVCEKTTRPNGIYECVLLPNNEVKILRRREDRLVESSKNELARAMEEAKAYYKVYGTSTGEKRSN